MTIDSTCASAPDAMAVHQTSTMIESARKKGPITKRFDRMVLILSAETNGLSKKKATVPKVKTSGVSG